MPRVRNLNDIRAAREARAARRAELAEEDGAQPLANEHRRQLAYEARQRNLVENIVIEPLNNQPVGILYEPNMINNIVNNVNIHLRNSPIVPEKITLSTSFNERENEFSQTYLLANTRERLNEQLEVKKEKINRYREELRKINRQRVQAVGRQRNVPRNRRTIKIIKPIISRAKIERVAKINAIGYQNPQRFTGRHAARRPDARRKIPIDTNSRTFITKYFRPLQEYFERGMTADNLKKYLNRRIKELRDSYNVLQNTLNTNSNIETAIRLYISSLTHMANRAYQAEELQINRFSIRLKARDPNNGGVWHFTTKIKHDEKIDQFDSGNYIMSPHNDDYNCIFYTVLYGYLKLANNYLLKKFKTYFENRNLKPKRFSVPENDMKLPLFKDVSSYLYWSKTLIDSPSEINTIIIKFKQRYGLSNTPDILNRKYAQLFLVFLNDNYFKLPEMSFTVYSKSATNKEPKMIPTPNSKSRIKCSNDKTIMCLCILFWDYHSFFVTSFCKRNLETITNEFKPYNITANSISTHVPEEYNSAADMINDTKIHTFNSKKKDFEIANDIVVYMDIETATVNPEIIGKYLKDKYDFDYENSRENLHALTELDYIMTDHQYLKTEDNKPEHNFVYLNRDGEPCDFKESLIKADITQPDEHPVVKMMDDSFNAAQVKLSQDEYVSYKSMNVYLYAHNGAEFDIPSISEILKFTPYKLCKISGAGLDLPEYSIKWNEEKIYLVSYNKNGKKVLKAITEKQAEEHPKENLERKEVIMSVNFLFRDSMKSFCPGKISLENFGIMNNVPDIYKKKSVKDKDKFFEVHSKYWEHYLINGEFPPTPPLNERELSGFQTFGEQFEVYGENDVYSLALAIENFVNAIADMEYEPIRQNAIGKVSAASLVTPALNSVLSKFEVENVKNKAIDRIFRQACYGGRSLMLSRGFIRADMVPQTQVNKYNRMKLRELKQIQADMNKPNEIDRIVYMDAVSLYPSVMWKYKFPTKLYKPSEKPELYTNDYWMKRFNEITNLDKFDKFIDDPTQAILKVRLTHTEGMIPCIPKQTKEGLIYRHHYTNETNVPQYATTIDIARAKYFNNAKFDIIKDSEDRTDGIVFHNERIFGEMIDSLFTMRKDCKGQMKELDNKNKKGTNEFASLNIKQEIYKLIMNSSYGKLLQRMIDERITYRTNLTENFEGHFEYGEQKLNIFQDTQIPETKAHIGAFVLSYSKVLMDRVISKLGGEENNYITCKYPIFSTDTDSFCCSLEAFNISKEILNIPGENILTGFHPDVEIEYKVKDNGEIINSTDPNYNTIEGTTRNATDVQLIASACIVSKTYSYLASGTAHDGSTVYGYHRRGKGLPAQWLDGFDFIDYFRLSTEENRSIKHYRSKHGLPAMKHTRFNRDKKLGGISTEEFDRSFPCWFGITKQRNVDYNNTEHTLPFLNYNPKMIPSN